MSCVWKYHKQIRSQKARQKSQGFKLMGKEQPQVPKVITSGDDETGMLGI